jgi:hypothetical protein
MIRFALVCSQAHEFEGWFRDNADFDKQQKHNMVSCPVCETQSIGKAIMAPSISTGRSQEKITLAMGDEQRRMMSEMRAMAQKMKAGADYVGDKFADEARKIHDGDTEPRGIYGEATNEEARSLIEDGIDFMPLPTFPEDHN